ncbi:phospholipid ABC transporter ATP-binding protein MlaF [Chromohalobacter salexigens]|nr:ATP-binding cassette domain-containing protein [Chromohalobacter salexigens]NWO56972.1 phospholipid ABC transporter ATP-binding protein MlaF [Chromohalobacter salexigens]
MFDNYRDVDERDVTDTTLVDVEGLHFSRGENEIFRGVDLRIPKGKITAVMGPSGTGKTTLLKLIGGQLVPDAGRVCIDGQDVHRLSRRALFRLRRRMGMLFQSGALFSDLNVFENVAFPLRVHTDLPEAMVRDIVLMKLQAVGLRGARNLSPAELSGGMARRVALARAVALDPELVLYDEPFVGQDPISMGVLVQLIKTVNQALGLTAVIVSHDIKETLSIADYVYIIADGQVMAHGTPQTLDVNRDARVKQFVHGEPDGPVPFHYPAPNFHRDILATGGGRP